MSEKDSSYQESLKSLDTEENIDLWFYRPIGYAWACLARKIGITPNAITIASIFLGIGAGVAFYFNNIWINIIGIVLLIWANSFDSADGQLARMTKQYSRIGRILDGLSGDIWFFTIYLSICLRENATAPFFSRPPMGYMGHCCYGRHIPCQTSSHGRLLPPVPPILPKRRRRQRTRIKQTTTSEIRFHAMERKTSGPRSYSSSTPTTHRVRSASLRPCRP